MGNTNSTSKTTSERYLEAIPFVPIALQDRIQAIEPLQLSAELGLLSPETSISAHWIAAMQKAGLLDWSNMQTVFAKCIKDIPKNKSLVVYVETLVEHILQKVRNEAAPAELGTYRIIKLAKAVNQHPECWELDDSSQIQNPLRLHQAAANALDAIDRHLMGTDLYPLIPGILPVASGRYLYDSHKVYKSLNLFIRAGFNQPLYQEDYYYRISHYDSDD
jgi:hypothetical protein